MEKIALARWAKVLNGIAGEANKTQWLRKFIPDSVSSLFGGTRIADFPTSAFKNLKYDRSLNVPLSRMQEGILNPNTSSTDLLSKFKDLSRDLSNNVLSREGMSHQNTMRKSLVPPTNLKLDWAERINALNPEVNFQPDTLVPFAHGGSSKRISDALLGKGYLADGGAGPGMMVTPNTLSSGRDSYYAARSAASDLGTPMQLQGYIPAKYLHAPRNFGYEATIPQQHLDKIVKPIQSPIALTSRDTLQANYIHPEEAKQWDWSKFNERVGRSNTPQQLSHISAL